MESIHIHKNKNPLVDTLLLLIPITIFGILLSIYLVSKSKINSYQIAVESNSAIGNELHSSSYAILGDQDSLDIKDIESLK